MSSSRSTGTNAGLTRQRLRLACAHRRDIVLIEDYLTEDDLSSLMGEATAYVSLHRSEGFGLTMAEAMARSRPVIATGYSGNLDFMNETNSCLVPYTLVPVPEGSGPYPNTTHWAEPSVEAAAATMRWVIDHPDEASRLGERARRSILSTNSLARTVGFVGERIAGLLDGLVQTESGAGASRLPRAPRLLPIRSSRRLRHRFIALTNRPPRKRSSPPCSGSGAG